MRGKDVVFISKAGGKSSECQPDTRQIPSRFSCGNCLPQPCHSGKSVMRWYTDAQIYSRIPAPWCVQEAHTGVGTEDVKLKAVQGYVSYESIYAFIIPTGPSGCLNPPISSPGQEWKWDIIRWTSFGSLSWLNAKSKLPDKASREWMFL